MNNIDLVLNKRKLEKKGISRFFNECYTNTRTLAMILYGDMDISTWNNAKGRKPVKTYLINETSFMSVIDEIEESLL